MKRQSLIVPVLLLVSLVVGCGGKEPTLPPTVALPTMAASSSPVTPAGDLATLLEQAESAIEAGNADGAIATLQQAIAIDSQSVKAYFLLGNAYAKKEQFGEAEQYFKQALSLDGTQVDARANLGVVYYRQGRLEEAEQTFREVLKQAPDDAEIQYNLGGVLAALNRLEEALTQFEKANRLDPSLPEPYLGLGTIYQRRGEKDKAIQALKEYIKLSQDPAWRAQAEQMLRELGG